MCKAMCFVPDCCDITTPFGVVFLIFKQKEVSVWIPTAVSDAKTK